MDIDKFMRGYKSAWEHRGERAFAALFHSDGDDLGFAAGNA